MDRLDGITADPAARLPRLHEARAARARGPDRLGRGPEGGLPARRAVRDAARHHRVGRDRGGGLEHAGGPGSAQRRSRRWSGGRPRSGPSCTAAGTPPSAFARCSPPTLSAYEDRNRRPRLRRPAAGDRVLRGGPRRGGRGHRRARGRRARGRALARGGRAATRRSPRSRERFHPTTRYADLAKVDAVIVAVPTPLTRNREPDLGPLIAAGTALAGVLQEGQLVVLESTTYPGTTRERLRAAARGVRAWPPGATSTWPSRPSGSTRAAPTTRCATRPRSSAA